MDKEGLHNLISQTLWLNFTTHMFKHG